MTLSVSLIDEVNNKKVRMTSEGELIVGDVDYSTYSYSRLENDSEVYNLIEPTAGEFIVVTGFLVQADKSVSSTNPQSFRIFSTPLGGNTSQESNTIFNLELIRNKDISMNSLRTKVPKGNWINTETIGEGDIFVTLFYYKVKEGVP